MSLRPSVVLVAYHFFPSREVGARRITALARYLAEQGLAVRVVCPTIPGIEAARQIHPAISIHDVVEPSPRLLSWGVAVKRAFRRVFTRRGSGARAGIDGGSGADTANAVAAPHAHSHGPLVKLFFEILHLVDNHKRWAMLATREAVRFGLDASVVIASGPPQSTLMAGARTARVLGIPFIADLRDPWTDYPHLRTQTGRPIGWRARALAMTERWTLRDAAAITCTTPTLVTLLSKRFRPAGGLHVILNGYDKVPELPPAETGNRLVILFAGEIYENRDPFPFLAAVDRLVMREDVDPSRVLVKFVGTCETFKGRSLRAWLKGKAADRVVEIHPPVPPSQVPALIGEATVLMNLAQKSPLQIPAKTFEHLVSGRELLVFCETESDTARLLDTVPGVLRLDPSDAASHDAALLDLYRRHVVGGRLNAPDRSQIARFSRDARNAQFLDLLERLAPQLAVLGEEQRA